MSTIQDLQNDLKAERAKTEENRLEHERTVLQFQERMADMKERARNVDTKLHHYIRILVVSNAKLPSSILKTQGRLCRAVHRMAVHARLVEMIKGQCTDIVHSVRQSMIDIEDECIDLETKLLKDVAEAEEEILQQELCQFDVLDSQQDAIDELTRQLLEEDQKRSVLKEDEGDKNKVTMRRGINNSLTKSFSKMSIFFSQQSKKLEEEEDVLTDVSDESAHHHHFFDSFADLKMEQCQGGNNSSENNLDDFFYSLTNLVLRHHPSQ